MSTTRTYFQDELRYLREIGPEFAKANPEIARTLADRGSDPDVERLLEGVAFLCGRIRQKLDDELPELTAGVMAMLWPHYLRSVPSMTIMEFLPDVEAMQTASVVPNGTEFASTAVDGTSCRYRSCWPTTVRPWTLEEARLESGGSEPVRLVLSLRTAPKVTLDQLDLSRVRLHLSGDPRTTDSLYLLLAAHISQVTVRGGPPGPGEEKDPGWVLDARAVQAAGLGRDQGVIPYPRYSFPGYRLLQEYLSFRERFMFIDIVGLDRAVLNLNLEHTISLVLSFNRRLDSYPLVSRDNLRLHCVPAVNLFSHAAEPIRIQHDRVEYPVLPSRSGLSDRSHAEVFSVDEVYGVVRTDTLTTGTYRPFFAFRHEESDGSPSYYQTRVEPNSISGDASSGVNMFISLIPGGGMSSLPADETISMELTCTNRHLPGFLRAGDICRPTDKSPSGMKFRNLQKPTATIAPPLGQALHWRLLSHLALNHTSLTDTVHFRNLLRVYDFLSAHDAQSALTQRRLLDGLVGLSAAYSERLIRGAVVRGTRISLELNEQNFLGEGDGFLFAGVLNQFFALYATLNSFTELRLRLSRSGQTHDFRPRWGEQASPAGARPEDIHD